MGNFSIWKSRAQLVFHKIQIHLQFYTFSLIAFKRLGALQIAQVLLPKQPINRRSNTPVIWILPLSMFLFHIFM